jgi:hypothetical protein
VGKVFSDKRFTCDFAKFTPDHTNFLHVKQPNGGLGHENNFPTNYFLEGFFLYNPWFLIKT